MAQNTEQRKIDIILNGQQVNASLKDMSAAAALMNNQLRKMATDDPGREKLKKDFTDMRGRIDQVKQELYGVEKASLAAKLGFNDMGGLMKTVLGTAGGFLVGGGIESLVSTVVDFFGQSSTAASEFEASLSNLSAITGATGEDLRFYEEQAQLIGQTTSLSASQAVEAFKLIGSAKPELLSNKEALAAVTQEAIALAEASGMELPEAANSLASSLNQFGAGAEEAGRFINVLAAGAKEGSSEITETSAALKNAGTVASGAGLSFEETNAALQSLAEISIKGGEAGTGLRNVLLTLQSGADDTNPAVVGLETALDNLGKKNLSTAELAKLFGKENVVVANQLVNSREKITDLTEAMTGTTTAYEQAATNLDNLEGDMKALDSATESLQIGLGEGLNVAIREGVKLLTGLVLVVKEAPAFLRENKDVIYTMVAAVAALNLGNAKAAATTLYHTAVEKGRAIATRASAAAQWVLNAAMTANPIGLVIAAVAALVGGFVILYNRSDAVRGGIAGLWAGFKELLSIAGDVASFLINPLKNAGKLKEIMNSGERLGKAFSDGYHQKLVSEKVAEEKKEQAAHEVKKKEAEKKGEELGTATNKGDAKAKKEREKQEKQHQKDLQQARDAYAMASEKAEQELANLKVEIMGKGIDQTLAKLRLQHEQEKAELEKRKQEVLSNVAATEEEKQALLDNYRSQMELKEQEYQARVKEAQEKEEQRTKEEKLTRLDEEEALEKERLELQFASTLDAEFQRDQAMLNLKKQTLQSKLAILEEAGLGETLQALKLKNAILKTDQETQDGLVANARRTEALKREVERRSFDNARFFLQVGMDLLGEDEKARKKHAGVIKAFSVGKIIVDLVQEISGYMAHPGSIASLGILGAAKAAFATARAGLAIKQVTAQQFAKGGMTKGKRIPMVEVGGSWQMAGGHSGGSIGTFAEGGWVNDAQLGLIGERGRELVLPNWMVESPKYANIVGYLEAERQKGVRAFVTGGMTDGPAPAIPSAEPAGEPSMHEKQVIQILESIQEGIEAWPDRLQVQNDIADVRKKLTVLNDLESRAFG